MAFNPKSKLKIDHIPKGTIKSGDLNTAFRAIRDDPRRQFNSVENPIPNRVNTQLCKAKREIPAFAMFSASNESPFVEVQEPYYLSVDHTDSRYMDIYTNGRWTIQEDDYFEAHRVQPNSIHLAKFLDEPEIGMPCGIISQSFFMSKEFTGFICVSPKLPNLIVDGEEVEDLYKVTIPNEKGHFLGIVTEKITAFDSSGPTLGKGKIQPQIRQGLSDDIEDSSFEIDVFNFHTHEIQVDMLVNVLPYINIGLVAHPVTGHEAIIGTLDETATAGDSDGPAGPFDLTVEDWETTGDKHYFDKKNPGDGTTPWTVEVWNQCEEIPMGERVQCKPICGKYMIDVVCCPPA